jgi:tetratricopeptide (TPR) repeat protein
MGRLRRTCRHASRTAGLMVCLLLGPGLSPEAAAQKDAFIDELIAFRLALAGTYGDEGPQVLASLDRLAAALAQWDRTLAAIEGDMRGALPGAPPERALLVHTTLASRFIERGRFREAMAEIDAAMAIDPRRPAFPLLRGLVQEIAGTPAGAFEDFERAWRLDPADPVKAYLVADRGLALGRLDDITPQLDVLMAALETGAAAGVDPFIQLALVADARADWPVFAPAAYADGFVHLSAGRLDEAVAGFRAAAEGDPLVAGFASRADGVRDAAALLREGRIAPAITRLEALAQSQASASEVHRLLGQACAAGERWSEAIASLRTAVRLAPDDERARLALAGALARDGQSAEAERVLRETLDRLPSSGEARWALADRYQSPGRESDAVAVLEAAAGQPMLAGRGQVYWRLAEIAHEQQDHDRVVDALSARMRLDPNRAAAHKALGMAQMRRGAREEALLALLLTAWVAPDDAETLGAVGQIHVEAERYEAAERVLQRAVGLAPDLAQARFALGTALVRLGRTAEGQEHLAEFQRLRQAALDEQRRLFERDRLLRDADLHAADGRHARAAEILQEVVALEPDDPVHRVALALALARAGDPEEAVAQLEAAAAMDAGAGVYRELATLYGQLGRDADRARAEAAYERLRHVLPAERPLP